MKEVKQFSKSYILVSALYVVLGIVLLAWPDTSIRMICYILGFAMVVLGITYGVMYFTKDNLEGFLQMDLVIGIICLAFGVFILLNPTFLATVLPFAMGIILLLGAVVKIQSSVNMRRLRFKRWYAMLICALIIIALGIVLLCNPFEKERHMILYIGICLVLDGLTNLTALFCIRIRVRKLARIQKEHPEAQLKELLEQADKEAAQKAGKKAAPAEIIVPASEAEETDRSHS